MLWKYRMSHMHQYNFTARLTTRAVKTLVKIRHFGSLLSTRGEKKTGRNLHWCLIFLKLWFQWGNSVWLPLPSGWAFNWTIQTLENPSIWELEKVLEKICCQMLRFTGTVLRLWEEKRLAQSQLAEWGLEPRTLNSNACAVHITTHLSPLRNILVKTGTTVRNQRIPEVEGIFTDVYSTSPVLTPTCGNSLYVWWCLVPLLWFIRLIRVVLLA